MFLVTNNHFTLFLISNLILLLTIVLVARQSLKEHKGALCFSTGIVFLGVSYLLTLFQDKIPMSLAYVLFNLTLILSLLMFSWGTFAFFRKKIHKKMCFLILSFFVFVYCLLFYGEYSSTLQMAALSLTLAFIVFYTSTIISFSFPQNLENTGLLFLSIVLYGLFNLFNAIWSITTEFVETLQVFLIPIEILYMFTYLAMVGWIFGLVLIRIRDLEFDIDCHLASLRRKDDERKQIENQLLEINTNLANQSRKDELTTLYNRRFIMAQFNTELARARRIYGAFSLVIIDLDLFKNVNDTYGHNFGDEVLVKISALFKGSLREVDYIGRYGGEEFMILLPNTTKDQAFNIMERIRKKVQALTWPYSELITTFSAGVLEINYDNANSSPTELIQIVDQCLYEAKSQGRNRVVVFEPQIDQETSII